MADANQPKIPGSFVQPPSSPTATVTAPPQTTTTSGPTHWANVAPAIVSSQQTSFNVPTVGEPRHTSAGVRFSAASVGGDDAASRTRKARQQFFAELSNISQKRELALRLKDGTPPGPANSTGAWSVYCNECDKPMADEHFHCSICDDGDYDLCPGCVSAGKICPGVNHWLIKRTLKDGQVINSVTEKILPRPKPQPQTEKEKEKEMPGAFTEEPKAAVIPPAMSAYESTSKPVPTRTCNSCVKGQLFHN